MFEKWALEQGMNIQHSSLIDAYYFESTNRVFDAFKAGFEASESSSVVPDKPTTTDLPGDVKREYPVGAIMRINYMDRHSNVGFVVDGVPMVHGNFSAKAIINALYDRKSVWCDGARVSYDLVNL